jgi:hypothetical protein
VSVVVLGWVDYADANEWLGYDGTKQAWYLTELGHEYAT